MKKLLILFGISIFMVFAFSPVSAKADAAPTYDYYLYVDANNGDVTVQPDGNPGNNSDELADYLYTSEQTSPAHAYKTIYAALKAAPADKSTKITLLSDITVGGDGLNSTSGDPLYTTDENLINGQYQILIDKNITLNLNGKTVTGAGNTKIDTSYIKVCNAATLTIEGEGTLTNFGNANYSSGMYITGNGHAILKDNCKITSGGRIEICADGTFTIISGEISNCSSISNCGGILNNGVLNIGGGKVVIDSNTVNNAISNVSTQYSTDSYLNIIGNLEVGSKIGVTVSNVTNAENTVFAHIDDSYSGIESIYCESADLLASTGNTGEIKWATVKAMIGDKKYPSVATAFAATNDAVTDTTIVMTADSTETIQINIWNSSNKITLDLNGYTLTGPGYNNSVIELQNNSKFTLQDSSSSGTGKIVQPATSAAGSTTYIAAIKSNHDSCSFKMDGGTIESYAVNYQHTCGGILMSGNSCTVTMTGGKIYSTNGIGIYIHSGWGNGLSLSGGTITSLGSHGVYLNSTDSTFSGGEIKDCNGSGIYLTDGNFVFSGGSIKNCSNSSAGAGIYAGSRYFTMRGGTVSGCSAPQGAGIYLTDNVEAFFSGNINISNNVKADNSLSNVYISNTEKFTLNGNLTGSIGISNAFVGTPANATFAAISSAEYTGVNCFFCDEDSSYIGIRSTTPGYTDKVVFTKGCTVNFEMNGHGTNPALLRLYPGETAVEPSTPSAEGYIFGGWYKEAACTNEWDFANDIVNDDTTIYAKWTAVYTPGPSIPYTPVITDIDIETDNDKDNNNTDSSEVTEQTDEIIIPPSQSTVEEPIKASRKDGVYVDENNKPVENAFVQTSKGIIYTDDNGKKVTKAIVTVVNPKDGEIEQYYAGKNGYIAQNELVKLSDGTKIFAGEDGSLVKDTIVTDPDSGKKYYMNEDGKAETRTVVKVDGKKYYTGKSGAIQKNKLVTDPNGRMHYCTKSGELATSKWITIGDTKYWCNKYGNITKSKKINK